MEHLTEALDRLGVKTCPVCGKTGVKSLCVACRSVTYCGKACQKLAWPRHKQECRRVVREKKKIRDGIAAAYAADEARAADACRADIPEGAECYICKNHKYWKGDLVRGCSCRGPHAGFVHVRCLVALAESRGEVGGENGDVAFQETVATCGQCRQRFRGPACVALARATFLHFAGRAETDHPRQQAFVNLGTSLSNVERLDESFVIAEDNLVIMRRLYGAGDRKTIEAEESVALLMVWRYDVAQNSGLNDEDSENDLQQALRTLQRTYTLKLNHFGRDNERTLTSAKYLADTHRTLGNFEEAEALNREIIAGYSRIYATDPTHFREYMVLESQHALAQVLVSRRKFDEARAMRNALLPEVHRVLGPDHKIMRDLQSDPHWDV